MAFRDPTAGFRDGSDARPLAAGRSLDDIVDSSCLAGTVMPLGELSAIGSAFLWACTSLLFTSAGRMASPVATNLFKTLAATLLFAVVLAARNGVPWDPTITPRALGLLVLSGILGLSLGDSLLFLAYQILGTRRAMLVQSVHPVLGAVTAWLVLSETIGVRAWLGILVTLAGIALVIADRVGVLLPSQRAHVRKGVLLALGAALGQALGALSARAALAEVDPLGATQIRVASGAVLLILFGLVRGELLGWSRQLTQPAVLRRLSIASVLGPFLAIWWMMIALDQAPTGVALTLLSLAPIWLLPLGAIFQRDIPSWREALGVIVAIGGVVLLVTR